ncbi:hypothetical protein [Devosia sp. CN2-171]|jgi:hypothetical protein|uniref:hypothetical protein n=1 Tax=Devosia sp. CN2-171 TaxID=3400909 RepID=UPI003BF7E1C0
MRSKSGLAGALVLIAGVPAALGSAIAFNGAGASEIIHVALAVSFLLFAVAVFDFQLALWLRWIFVVGISVLAAIFLVQAVADLARSTEIKGIAYGVLGQVLEKWLGYLFIAWCAVICFIRSVGILRIVGLLALALVVGTEIYGFTVRASGEAPPQALKFLYLPLIAWLGVLSLSRPPTE